MDCLIQSAPSASSRPSGVSGYRVTKSLWFQIVTNTLGLGYTYNNSASGKADNHPVQSMDWYDAVKWCNARSQNEGRTPCYYSNAGLTIIYKTGESAPFVKWDANGYRLPTEAEWEKTARGGLSANRFPWGDCITWSNANYYANPIAFPTYDCETNNGNHPDYYDLMPPYTSPVSSFPSNSYRLYDMAGNVAQWCWDWYDDAYYSSSPVSDPRGPASGTERVFRGGSWNNTAHEARCANRNSRDPTSPDYTIGFWCVRGLP